MVSIVITNYNYNKYLKEAIDSCLYQTVKPLEIIVVDDCSKEVPDIPEEVKLIVNPVNIGVAASRNKGIKESKGEYIISLDADDYLHPKFIENTIGKSDIVSSNISYFGKYNRKREFKEFPSLEDFKKNNQIVNTSIFKKKVWLDIGGYSESLNGFEDWDFWYRAVKKGFKVQVVQEVLSFYRVHSKDSRNHQAMKNYDTLYSAIFL